MWWLLFQIMICAHMIWLIRYIYLNISFAIAFGKKYNELYPGTIYSSPSSYFHPFRFVIPFTWGTDEKGESWRGEECERRKQLALRRSSRCFVFYVFLGCLPCFTISTLFTFSQSSIVGIREKSYIVFCVLMPMDVYFEICTVHYFSSWGGNQNVPSTHFSFLLFSKQP